MSSSNSWLARILRFGITLAICMLPSRAEPPGSVYRIRGLIAVSRAVSFVSQSGHRGCNVMNAAYEQPGRSWLKIGGGIFTTVIGFDGTAFADPDSVDRA